MTAFRYGELESTRARLYYDWHVYGEDDGPARLAYYFWLLEHGDELVLVDTGFDPASAARRGRTALGDPLALLAAHGVPESAITTVVVTHFHYDHIGNVARLPRARLLVPGEELDFWRSPVARSAQLAAHVEVEELQEIERADAEGRVERYEQGRLFPGVEAVHLPGHTPGLHGLLVEGVERTVLLTSDAVHLYDELATRRPFGLFTDLVSVYDSYDEVERLRTEHDALLVPGHDPAVGAGVTRIGTTAEPD